MIDVHLARKVGRMVQARTRDLGTGGASVVSRRPLRVDEELHFDLDLPAGAGHVSGTARVLRQHLHDTYALRFERMDNGGSSQLVAFVADRA